MHAASEKKIEKKNSTSLSLYVIIKTCAAAYVRETFSDSRWCLLLIEVLIIVTTSRKYRVTSSKQQVVVYCTANYVWKSIDIRLLIFKFFIIHIS